MAAAIADGPRVTDEEVVFTTTAPDGALRAVRLWLENEIKQPDVDYDFERDGERWVLHLPWPDVDRFEYQLELRGADGTPAVVCDPANPKHAGGPFGEKSVVELPGYAPPRWLAADEDEAAAGTLVPISIRSRVLRGSVDGLLWSSPDTRPDQPAPLLVAHDG